MSGFLMRGGLAAAMLLATQVRAQAAGQLPATVVEPSVISGKILTPSIDVTKAPGLPEVQLSVDAGTVGIASIQITLTSPSGNHSINTQVAVPQYPAEQPKEDLDIQLKPTFGGAGALGPYAEPGAWFVSGIQLFSNANEFITYYGMQAAALFPAGAVVKVVNPGTPDVVPPDVGAGAILTPTVSLSEASPVVLAKLKLSDNLSGISSASVVLTGPVGSSGFPSQLYASRQLLTPTLSTEAVLYQQLTGSPVPTGTYTITSLSACDAAGNCSNITAPDEIAKHFATTTVTLTK